MKKLTVLFLLAFSSLSVFAQNQQQFNIFSEELLEAIRNNKNLTNQTENSANLKQEDAEDSDSESDDSDANLEEAITKWVTEANAVIKQLAEIASFDSSSSPLLAKAQDLDHAFVFIKKASEDKNLSKNIAAELRSRYLVFDLTRQGAINASKTKASLDERLKTWINEADAARKEILSVNSFDELDVLKVGAKSEYLLGKLSTLINALPDKSMMPSELYRAHGAYVTVLKKYDKFLALLEKNSAQ